MFVAANEFRSGEPNREALPFPSYGRFMQPDPLGYADDSNPYAYVGNDPMNNADPLGLEQASIEIVGKRLVLPGCINSSTSVLCGGSGLMVAPQPASPGGGTAPIVVVGKRPGPAPEPPIIVPVPKTIAPLPARPLGPTITFAGFPISGLDEDYQRDLNICRRLASPAARSRCYGSAEARRYARENGKELPPLITWRNGALVTTAIILYWIISEGSRILFPPRNLVPVP